MRIIAGEHRGRRLKSVDRPGLRPTTDRVRESIFNLLASRIEFEGAAVLDLFAGTGALGLEALSRGAATCEFVEKDRRCAAVIAENLSTLGVDRRSCLTVGDVMKALGSIERTFDLVLADPPYHAPIFAELLSELFRLDVLADGGVVVLEHAGSMRPVVPATARVLAERTFGDSAVTILARADRLSGA